MQDQAKPKRPYHFRMSMSKEELHAIRSATGKLGGRPKGSVNSGYTVRISKEELSFARKLNASNPHRSHNPHRDAAAPGEQRFAMNMPKSAYEIFSKCAIYNGETRIQFLYDLALSLRADPRYAHLFAMPAEPQTKEETTDVAP